MVRNNRLLAGSLRLTLLFTLLLTPAIASGQGDPAQPAEGKKAEKPKLVRAKGDCATPNKAIDTLLRYLMDDNVRNPGRAAACIDRTGLARPVRDTPALALKLKKVLDARGLFVVMKDIPSEHAYKNDDGEHRYTLFPTELPDMTWERNEKDGRWLLTPGSRDRIPAVYANTFPLGVNDLMERAPDWLRSRFLGVQVWQFLGIGFLILFSMFLHWLTIWLFKGYVKKFTRKIHVKWVEAAILTADRPSGVLLVAGAISLLFPILQFPVGLNKVVMLGARTMAAFALVWLGFRLIDVLMSLLTEKAEGTETKMDDQLIPLIRKSIKLFLAIVGGIFILQNLSVDVGSLIAGVGLGGLAFALAAKDTVANLFGSLMIFIDKPFQIGDSIQVGSVEGTVEEVGFRTTRVRTYQNSLITLPNSIVTNSAIDNLGARQKRRYKTTLGLTYDTPPEKVAAFCEGVRAIIASLEGMNHDSYYVEFHSFGESSLNIMVYSFIDTQAYSEELALRTTLNLSILGLAKDLGIAFAFPSQSLYVESMPGHPMPAHESVTRAGLATVVDSYGPGGARSLPAGIQITHGYAPGSMPKKTS